jgi:hypothetical protein
VQLHTFHTFQKLVLATERRRIPNTRRYLVSWNTIIKQPADGKIYRYIDIDIYCSSGNVITAYVEFPKIVVKT